MKTNQAGIDLIKKWESFESDAYVCPAGWWTVGWGHTGRGKVEVLTDGTRTGKSRGVKPGMRVTRHMADVIFDLDLEYYEADVAKLLGDHPATSNEFSALVSFAFNVGPDIDADTIPEGLGDSRLLRLYLAGDKAGAAAEFGKWIHSNGKPMPGLVKRRAEERALFLKP